MAHIDFKTHGVELSNDIREYAEEKIEMLEKLLVNIDEENKRFEVELAKRAGQQTGDIFRADIVVLAGAERVHAVGHGETLFAAIDEAKDDLTRRLRRNKTKTADMVRKGGAAIKKMLRFWE